LRVYKTRWFTRFARRAKIGDDSLCEAVARAERGIIDADLGGGLIKQRVARKGQGRSGGYRTLLAFRLGGRAVFLYGFAKKEIDNIGDDELRDWRDQAADILGASEELIKASVADERLKEIDCGDEEEGT
jgi:hypothetical protein